MQKGRIRTIIADDQSVFIDYMIEMLAPFTEIEIAGRALNGIELIELIQQESIHAVFCDIQMSPLDGLEIAERLHQIDPNISLVYVTAFPEKAFEAFGTGACDFLSKPVSIAKLKRSVERIVKDQMFKQSLLKPPLPPTRILIQKGNENIFVALDDIYYIEKVDRQSVLYMQSGQITSYDSLDSLENRLDSRFLRTHRGFIINTAKVSRFEPANSNSYTIHFTGYAGTALLIRKKLNLFMDMLMQR